MRYMMIVNKFILATAICTIITCSCYAQSESTLHGLWLMEHVQIGDQEMTPVARWTRILADGTYESGNGWLKSSEGTWTYNETDKAFLPKETNGITDPYGAFTVQPSEDGMTWSRVEDGMEVVVTLKPIDELPKAPSDNVQGLWDLVDAAEGEASALERIDPDGAHYLFIRWDRIYIERDAEGNRGSGYWHMDGHNPVMTLLSHQERQEPQSWNVSFDQQDNLVLKGASDSNRDQTLTYTRIIEFPE